MRKVHQLPDVRLFFFFIAGCPFIAVASVSDDTTTVLQDVIVFIDFMNTNRKLSCTRKQEQKNIRRKKRSYGISFQLRGQQGSV